MAFVHANLFRIATAGNNGVWLYVDKDNDGATTVDTSGYFNGSTAFGGAYYDMAIGDIIIRVSASTYDATLKKVSVVGSAGHHVVMTKSAGVLNVSDTTALTVTNTD